MKTVEDAIMALRARGFEGHRARGDGEVPFTVLFTFAWQEPFLDAVHLRSEEDATALRVRTDRRETLENLLDIASGAEITEGEEWWTGPFVPLVQKILELRPLTDPRRPARFAVTGSGLWVPGRAG